MPLRRLVVIPSALAIAALAATPTTAAPTPSIACGDSQGTVLFWPHGHKAISSVGFPNIRTPHLEVYSPSAGYPSSNFQLYTDAKGVVDPSATCTSSARAKVKAVAHPKTIKTKRAVTCTGDTALLYDVKKTKSGVTVIGRTAAAEVWRVVLNKHSASKLTFDSKACRAKASPH